MDKLLRDAVAEGTLAQVLDIVFNIAADAACSIGEVCGSSFDSECNWDKRSICGLVCGLVSSWTDAMSKQAE